MRPQRNEPMRTPIVASPERGAGTERDDGFTLPELIIVVVILGLLAAAASLGVSGMSTQASETGCAADRRQLHTAAEAYLTEARSDVIPVTGAGHDAVERTLVADGLLQTVSTYHDLATDGHAVAESGSPC